MTLATLELPNGAVLEREIYEIEMHDHDKRIRETISERIEIADCPATVFIPHDEVFAVSRARLMEKLRH